MKELNPTEYFADFWIYRVRSFRDRDFCSSSYTGKWIAFIPKAQIDQTWTKVLKALHEEKLGPAAKVSSSRPNPRQADCPPGHYMIVVYTDDYSNAEDLERIRKQLRKVGVTGTLYYKQDLKTLQGLYGPEHWYIVDEEASSKKKAPAKKKAKKS